WLSPFAHNLQRARSTAARNAAAGSSHPPAPVGGSADEGLSLDSPSRPLAVRPAPRARAVPRGGLALRGDLGDLPPAARHIPSAGRGSRAVSFDPDPLAHPRLDAARRAVDDPLLRAP